MTFKASSNAAEPDRAAARFDAARFDAAILNTKARAPELLLRQPADDRRAVTARFQAKASALSQYFISPIVVRKRLAAMSVGLSSVLAY
jgi:hypothetical protein